MMTYKEVLWRLKDHFRCHNDKVRHPYLDEAERLTYIAIEKQIPKKPENHSGHYSDNLCPLCGKRVKSGVGSSSRQRDDYCYHCGQALDWSECE